MSNQVMSKLLESVGVNFYSIMCDEYTDISSKEQLSFCFRWVNDNLGMFGKFLGLYGIPNIASDTITTVIKDVHTRYQLSLDKCRSYCYDGASKMVRKSSGAAVRV